MLVYEPLPNCLKQLKKNPCGYKHGVTQTPSPVQWTREEVHFTIIFVLPYKQVVLF